MKKWILIILLGLVGLFLVVVLVIYTGSSMKLDAIHVIPAEEVVLPIGKASIEKGKHLARTRGCFDCHGEILAGYTIMDNPAMGQFRGPNLTPSPTSPTHAYSDADWVRAIRHGVAPGGRPLFLMPSQDYYYLGDADLGRLIAYVKSVPPVDNTVETNSYGPIARMLIMSGKLPLAAEVIDHRAPRPDAPLPGVTVEYGKYLAFNCFGCHGEGLSGGPIPGGDPKWPAAANLTPDKASGLSKWSEADFFKAMRQAQRPNGSEIDKAMPRSFAAFNDDELKALWLYLGQVEAKPFGQRNR